MDFCLFKGFILYFIFIKWVRLCHQFIYKINCRVFLVRLLLIKYSLTSRWTFINRIHDWIIIIRIILLVIRLAAYCPKSYWSRSLWQLTLFSIKLIIQIFIQLIYPCEAVDIILFIPSIVKCCFFSIIEAISLNLIKSLFFWVTKEYFSKNGRIFV